MAKRKSISNMESLIADGEATGVAYGFKSQTVNGSGRAVGTGWNRQYDWPTAEQEPEGGAWQEPRSNRTAE